MIPAEKFTEIAACEAELTEADWEGLVKIIVAALAISDTEIMSETRRLTTEWQDRPEGLDWTDGLGRKDGQIWIPELDELWRKVLGLYHNSPITGHLGTTGTLELVLHSYWPQDLPGWVKRYVKGCHMCQ